MVEPVTTAVAVTSLFGAAKLFEFAFGGMIGNLTSSAASSSLALAKRLIKRDGQPANHDVARSIHTAFVKSMKAIVVDAGSAPNDAADRLSLEALSSLIQSDELAIWDADNVQIPYEQLEQSIGQIYGRQGVPAKLAATERLIAFLDQRLSRPLTPTMAGVLMNGHKGPCWADLFELFFAEEVKTNERVFRVLLLDRTNDLLTLAKAQALQIEQLQRSEEKFATLIIEAIITDGDKTRDAIAETIPLFRNITRFKVTSATPGSFRAYLESGQLPYCSRSDFAVGKGIAGQFEFDEAAMLSYLESGPHQVLVLSGPGGVGKTRLALELGQRLTQSESRVVANLNSAASGQDLETFVRGETHTKFAFILDYGETASNLDELVQTIDALADQIGSEIALIVTCRDSAAEKVAGSVSQLDSKVLSLSAETGNVAKYQEWLTSSILAHIPEADRGALVYTCRSVPALAAFALFLYRSHANLFDEQFRQLGATDDFAAWIEHRATAVLKHAQSSAAVLTELAVSLPMPLSFRDKLVDKNDEKSRLLLALEADRWVEREGEHLVPAHDVLADGLAARWLLGSPGSVTTRVGDALRRAFDEDRLRTAFQVLDRLAYHANFNQLNGAVVLGGLKRQQKFDEADYLGALLGGRLLDPDEKLQLLLSDPEYADIVFDDPTLRLALTAAIEDLADWSDQNETEAIKQRDEQLFPLLDRIANAADAPSNISIRRLYHFSPERYRDQALANIDQFATAKQTHFLLTEMVRMGEPLDLLTGRVLDWLDEQGGRMDRASYVYEAWLERKCDPELVKTRMLEWLEAFKLKEDAGFVLKAWLRTTFDVATVKPYLKLWLDRFGTVPSASHVIESYARADGLGEESRLAVTTYLAECAEDRFAGLVYAAWLDVDPADCSLDPLIQDYLDRHCDYRQLSTVLGRWIRERGATQDNKIRLDNWCPLHRDHIHTSFVLSAWLDKGGSIDECLSHMQGWLDNFGKKPVAQHLFISIMRRGKGLGVLEQRTADWLAEQRLHPSSWHFYGAWLKHGLRTSEIRGDFLAWLEVNHLAEGADGTMRAWLDAGEPFGSIRPFALAWLHKNRENPIAVYLTKALSVQISLPDQAVTDIAIWAACFYESEDAIWRLWRLRDKLRWTQNNEPIVAYLHASQLCLDLHATRLSPENHFLLDRLVSALGRYFNWVDDPGAACVVLRKVLCEGKVYQPDARFQMQGGTKHVVPILISEGMLDPIADRSTIEAFAAMLRRPDHNPDILLEFLQLLHDVAPHIDWQGLGLDPGNPLDPTPNPT